MNEQIIQNLRDAVEPLADLIREVDAFREPGQRDLPFEEGAARRLVAAVRDELGRLETMQADHKRALEYAEERRQHWQNEAGREHLARIMLKDDLQEAHTDLRDARDALASIDLPASGANADLLEAVANEIDCGDGCEYGHTEHDTNAFVCHLMEKGTCGSTNAISLREIAKAFNVRAAIKPQPTGHFAIEHDGFAATVIGHYTTLEGKRGVVLQQDGTRVVHVYGEKWLKPSTGDLSAVHGKEVGRG